VKLIDVTVHNFCGIDQLDLNLGGDSAVLIGANGSGKSTIIRAIALALGVQRSVSVADFTQTGAPIEITCTLTELGPTVAGEFADYADFSAGGPKLRLGARATLDGPDVEVVCGFPDDGWIAARRSALGSLPVIVLSDGRDAARITALVGRGSLLAPLIASLDLEAELAAAGSAVEQATSQLASATPLVNLLAQISAHLRTVLSEAPAHAFGLEGLPAADLLRELELLLEYQTFPQPLGRQPSGLKQLTTFSVVMQLLTQTPGTLLLVDEPEISLHPQAQRALMTRLETHSSQLLAATHSPDVLVRTDLRRVVRLERSVAGTVAHQVSGITDAKERSLARHVSAGLAEAFFARTVIVVEGPGDRMALNCFAETLDVDLDARGASIVEMDGADLFETLRTLLGPPGLGIRILGLCDQDREQSWSEVLLGAGNYTGDRSTLEQHGVYVLDPDIEGVLVATLGDAETEQAITDAGMASKLQKFRNQPANAGMPAHDQLLAFVRHKRQKTVLPPILASNLAAEAVPGPIARLLRSV